MKTPVCSEERGPTRDVIAQLLEDALQAEGPEHPEQALIKPHLVRYGALHRSVSRDARDTSHPSPGRPCPRPRREPFDSQAVSRVLAEGDMVSVLVLLREGGPVFRGGDPLLRPGGRPGSAPRRSLGVRCRHSALPTCLGKAQSVSR